MLEVKKCVHLAMIAGVMFSAHQVCAADELADLQPIGLEFLTATSPEDEPAWFGRLFDGESELGWDEQPALAAFSNVSLAAAQESQEADVQAKVRAGEPHFGVAFALWLPGIDGTLGAGGFTTDVSATFLDIFDEANRLFGFGGAAQYRGEKWGAYLSGYWSTIELDQSIVTGTLTTTNDVGLVGFGVLYELGRWAVEHTAEGDLAARDMTLTLYGGARWTSVSVEFDFPILPSLKRSESWTNPMIGASFTYPFSQHWSIVLGGDIGGFGAASDLAWAATAVVSWDFQLKRLPASLQLGYLAIGDDYTTGSGTDEFVWDAILHGLLLNFTVKF